MISGICSPTKAVFRKKMIGGRVAEGHCEGEGVGGPPARSSILQSEWEAKKRSIATLFLIMAIQVPC
jgi:hypothetical protein